MQEAVAPILGFVHAAGAQVALVHQQLQLLRPLAPVLRAHLLARYITSWTPWLQGLLH